MKIKIQGSVIFADQLVADREIFDAVARLNPGDGLWLAVDGIYGTWQKAASPGRHMGERLTPVGSMAKVWSRMQVRRGTDIELKLLDPEDGQTDDYLRLLDEMMPEWNAPDDEEAFGQLRSL